jgi:HPt (histidine-containing phosphotransfer) domain-containing protein
LPEAVFDLEGLVERLGDRDFIPLFVRKYIEGTTELMKVLKEAVAEENRDLTHMQSHSIKGAAASIGAEAMRSIAQRMESLARNGEMADLPGLFVELERAFGTFQEVAPGQAEGDSQTPGDWPGARG